MGLREDSDMTGEDGKPLISTIECGDLEKEVIKWINEIAEAMPKSEEEWEEGWDDVHGGTYPWTK